MASGKKNYFRHSFFARNDDFIILLIDEMGYQGYFLWFALLEICGEIAADNYPESFKIHNSRLLRSLRCRQEKLDSFLTLARQESRLSWTRVENNHFIQIHNFPKYLGKYENLKDPNSPNKRKEKERKEKERKEKEIGEPGVDFEVDKIGVGAGDSPDSDAPRLNLNLEVSDEDRKKFSDAMNEALDAMGIELPEKPKPKPVEEIIPPKVSRIKGLRKPDFRFILGEPL